jgi:phage FluMu protein Com
MDTPRCTLCNKLPSYTSKIDKEGYLYYLCIECVDRIRV